MDFTGAKKLEESRGDRVKVNWVKNAGH